MNKLATLPQYTALVGAIALSAIASAQFDAGPESKSTRYETKEFMIPMRDGVKLHTVVCSPANSPGKHPILLERTPYNGGSFNMWGIDRKYRDAAYILAFQDVRGKYASEGDYVNVRPQLKSGQKGIDESTDTWDTVDYLVKNVPDNNGSVGLHGISYPGFYAGVGAINTHPALKAVSPQAPVSDWFMGDDVHHNGAFFMQDSFEFSLFFDIPRKGVGQSGQGIRITRNGKSAYDFYLDAVSLSGLDRTYLQGRIPYWTELLEHPNYDGYWKDRSLPSHMKNVRCAVLTVGGWFDAEDMWGALNLYKATGKQNKGTPNYLVMGPWFHGMWAAGTGRYFGDHDFGMNTSRWYRDNVEFPFFERYLRGQDVPTPSGATVFETGANNWLTFPQWPPKGLHKAFYYLGADKTLATEKPKTAGTDQYVYDPAKPTPYVANYESSSRRPTTYMVGDQRFAESRSDVLSYVTPEAKEDISFAGPVDVDLWVTTTGTDADFVVKLIDVWPNDAPQSASTEVSMAGYEQLVRGDVFRARFRDSFEHPKPFVSGTPTRVHFHMNDWLHCIKKGHKLMVQVQSAWFPLVDRNPNSFVDIGKAEAKDYHPATIQVLRDPKHASSIGLEVLDNASSYAVKQK